jgi:hypothetical protein
MDSIQILGALIAGSSLAILISVRLLNKPRVDKTLAIEAECLQFANKE